MPSSIVWHKSCRGFIILIHQKALCLNKKLSVNKQMKQEYHLFGLTSLLNINTFVAAFHLPSFSEQGCSLEFLSETLK